MTGAAAVQQSSGSGALSDALRDPLQASTGIFGADALQMSSSSEECRASGGVAHDDGCHEPAALCREQGGVPKDGSCHPAPPPEPAPPKPKPEDQMCMAPAQDVGGVGNSGPSLTAERGSGAANNDYCSPAARNQRAEARTGNSKTKCSMAFGARGAGPACDRFAAAQADEARKCGM